jgi:hypothetical protein
LKCETVTYFFIFLSHCAIAPSGQGLPHYEGFPITLRHATLGRTPLDDITWTYRPLPTQHTTLKREISINPLGFEVAIPARRAATDPQLRRQSHRDRLFFSNLSNSTMHRWKYEEKLGKKSIFIYQALYNQTFNACLRELYGPLTFKNRAYVPLPCKCCILYIFSTNISTEYFKHAAHSPSFSSKCLLFHSATFFGFCIIHILHTECAKI